MNKLHVSKQQLRGLLMVAAKQDVRFYLNGILIDFDTKRLVATDGHIMMFFRPDDMQGEGSFIISRDQVDSIVKLGGAGKKTFEPQIEITCTDDKITTSYMGTEISGGPVDGKFPECDRVVPEKFSGVPSQIQGSLYGLAEKALQLCAGDSVDKYAYVHVAHNGAKSEKSIDGAAVAFMPTFDRAFLVVMPFRPDEKLKYQVGCADRAKEIVATFGVKS